VHAHLSRIGADGYHFSFEGVGLVIGDSDAIAHRESGDVALDRAVASGAESSQVGVKRAHGRCRLLDRLSTGVRSCHLGRTFPDGGDPLPEFLVAPGSHNHIVVAEVYSGGLTPAGTTVVATTST
jgi:hypothetical protein